MAGTAPHSFSEPSTGALRTGKCSRVGRATLESVLSSVLGIAAPLSVGEGGRPAEAGDDGHAGTDRQSTAAGLPATDEAQAIPAGNKSRRPAPRPAAQAGAGLRLAPAIPPLAATLDSLYVGFGAHWYHDPYILDVLYDAKVQAQRATFGTTPAPVHISGADFVASPRGAQGYEFIIANKDLKVAIATNPQHGQVMPEVYVEFRAYFLWREGPAGAMTWLRNWLDCWCDIAYDKVSRTDLCVDLATPLPDINTKRDVVSRAVNRADYTASKHSAGLQTSGYTFGAGDLMARLYDKTHQARQKQITEHYAPAWIAAGWDGHQPITRFEVQLRRKTLAAFKVNTFADLTARQADIWQYTTRKWLRIVEPQQHTTAREHRERWPSTPLWRAYEHATDYFGTPAGLHPTHEPAPSVRQLTAQALGCAQAVWAEIASAYDPDQADAYLATHLGMTHLTEDFRTEARRKSAAHATLN